MGFCDPGDIGLDFCEPWGGSTDGHQMCYTGWSDTAGFGQDTANAQGCGPGCASCLDWPEEVNFHADWRDGNRWMRPAPFTRDAMGRFHDLRTNEPWPMQPGANYEWGACYHNTDGVECFNMPVCTPSCYRGGLRNVFQQSAAGPPDPRVDLGCPGGIAPGQGIPMFFPDIHFYTGDGQAGDFEQNCRRFNESPTKRRSIGGRRFDRMATPAFPRFFPLPYAYDPVTPCVSDVVTECSGKWQQSAFPCGSAYEFVVNQIVQDSQQRQFWMHDPACRNVWATLSVFNFTGSIAPGPSRTMRAEAEVRSTALRRTASRTMPGGAGGGQVGIKFDRLDQRTQTGQYNNWTRTYNGDDNLAVLSDDRSLLRVYPNCVAPNGNRVAIEMRAYWAEMGCYLNLHKTVRLGTGGARVLEVEPHARFVFSVRLAWRSLNPVDAPDNADPLKPPPGVQFRLDDGRPFYPPATAEWFGYLGRLGINFPGKFFLSEAVTLGANCGIAAAAVGGMEINGWPNVREVRRGQPYDPKPWPYMGSVQLRFLDPARCAG